MEPTEQLDDDLDDAQFERARKLDEHSERQSEIILRIDDLEDYDLAGHQEVLAALDELIAEVKATEYGADPWLNLDGLQLLGELKELRTIFNRSVETLEQHPHIGEEEDEDQFADPLS